MLHWESLRTLHLTGPSVGFPPVTEVTYNVIVD